MNDVKNIAAKWFKKQTPKKIDPKANHDEILTQLMINQVHRYKDA